MNSDTVRRLLRAEVKRQGGEAQFAHRAGVSTSLVNAILHGTREPRGKVLDALGLELTYRRKLSSKTLDSGEVP